MKTETEKRHELQLILLREGYSQDEAREGSATWPIDKLDDPLVERMREDAMRFPERAIVPPGTIDLMDLKSQRREAVADAEEQEYYDKQDRLAELMALSFSISEMPTAVLQALLGVLQASGQDRLSAINEIIKEIKFLEKVITP